MLVRLYLSGLLFVMDLGQRSRPVSKSSVQSEEGEHKYPQLVQSLPSAPQKASGCCLLLPGDSDHVGDRTGLDAGTTPGYLLDGPCLRTSDGLGCVVDETDEVGCS